MDNEYDASWDLLLELVRAVGQHQGRLTIPARKTFQVDSQSPPASAQSLSCSSTVREERPKSVISQATAMGPVLNNLSFYQADLERDPIDRGQVIVGSNQIFSPSHQQTPALLFL